MANKEENKGSFYVHEFVDNSQPQFTYLKNKDYVCFGANNDFPNYLIDIYNRNSIHGAIVKGKSSYLFGKGLTINSEVSTVLDRAKAEAYLDYANPYESWNDVYQKTCEYFELNNGFAWQIIWNQNGSKIAETYCMEWSKLRKSKCGKFIYFCDKWVLDNGQINPNPEKDESYKCYPVYNPKIRTGTQIFYFKLNTPSSQKYGETYPIPEYAGCIADIETDIEITSFHYHNLKNGMFAQGLLIHRNGEPDLPAMRKIAEKFTYSHTGTKRTAKIIHAFINKGDEAPEYQSLAAPDLDKLFEPLGKRIQQNIFTAHRVTSPMLFGVKTEGQLGGRSEIVEAHEMFKNDYVEPRQNIILKEIKALSEINGVNLDSLEVIQNTPIGVELPENPNILQLFDKADLQKYFAKKYGIEITNTVESVQETPGEVSQVNEHLKNLTGKQWINIKRLVREVNNKKLDREVASMMLKNSYGLNDQDIEILLKTPETQFKKFDIERVDRTSELIALFDKYAIQDNDDPILYEYVVENEKEMLRHQIALMKFQNDYSGNADQLKNDILNTLSGNPSATNEDISKSLGVDVKIIAEIIATMVATGLIVDGINRTLTPKAEKIEIEPMETEAYTVYSYSLSPKVSYDSKPNKINSELLETSHPFCKEMVTKSRAGKRWTQEAIENISNDFGMEAWNYRGGFTGHTGKPTTNFCNHIWKAIVKTRTKKK